MLLLQEICPHLIFLPELLLEESHTASQLPCSIGSSCCGCCIIAAATAGCDLRMWLGKSLRQYAFASCCQHPCVHVGVFLFGRLI